jgi:hypothetical protein
MAVSLFFCLNLLLMEYLRLMILGMALACVYVTFPRSFACYFAGVCFLAVAYGYTYLMLDPSLNGISLMGEPVQAFNSYRVLTLGLLCVCALMVLQPYLLRQREFSELKAQFTPVDVRVLIALGSVTAIYTVLDALHAIQSHHSVVQALLRGTKGVDLALVYLLVRSLTANPPYRRRHANLLCYAFLAFCAFATLVGGIRATRAYNKSRFPQRIDEYLGSRRRGAMVGVREKLLRVFALSSRETRLVFEAGYHAGQADWEAAGRVLARSARFPRAGLDEVRMLAEISTGAYRAALSALEALPPDYEFSAFTRQRLREIKLPLHEPGDDAEVLYLAGLLALHDGDRDQMKALMDQYLETAPLHANALYFRYLGEAGQLDERHSFRMPARGWLRPQDLSKPMNEQPGHITLPFNQQLRGYAWLPTGRYDVELWARDDGTLLSPDAQAEFDPACKTRVWVGRDMATFSVYSTNRQFQAYIMQADIRVQPVTVVVEFLNDTFDDEHGWDRNLSIAHLTFRRMTSP